MDQFLEPTLLLGKYWSTFWLSLSDVYVISVGVCFVVAILTVGYTAKNRILEEQEESKKSNEAGGIFEICPDDEVTFESLLTPDELLVEKAKQSASKFQLLDPKCPTKHIEEFLSRHQDRDSSGSDEEDTLSEEDEEIGSASSLLGRVKLARQEAVRRKLEAEMTDKDKLQEKMIQQQQLARIYSLLSQNQDSFGDVTFNDVKKQMNMYTPS